MIKSVIKIQRWIRLIRWRRYMRAICSNYQDHDPITLEPIKDIPRTHIAFITCPATNRFMACDAVAWATYFATSNTTKHPCTRQKIRGSDVWTCFMTARPFLKHDVLAVYQSTKLIASQKSRGLVAIHPSSPLFCIKIFNLSSILQQGDLSKKLWTFVYALQETHRPASIANVTHKLTITLSLPANSRIQIL